MSDVVIRAEHLGKKYIIGHQAQSGGYTALRDVLMQGVRGMWAKTRDLIQGKPIIQGHTQEEVWALKDVNFEVRQGEALGIIGRNGAGKSTLLKILSRITEPTEGRVTLKGRVASLLEVGTGFHAELSGRENIYLNGAILGMSRREIDRKFDEIVAFAEVEKFLDTPVKRYSSGMYVRLAFAVAAHLEPEILIVDEVLAVGDAAFQKKCLGKMGDAASEGRTVLFVSHNMNNMTRLCTSGLLLQNGYIRSSGAIETVVGQYLMGDFGTTAIHSWETGLAPGNETARLLRVEVHDINSVTKESFNIGEMIGVSVTYEVMQANKRIIAGFNFFNEMGINIFDSHDTTSEWHRSLSPQGVYRATAWIPDNLLAEGVIIVGVGIITPDPFEIHAHEKNVVSFNVVDGTEQNTARGEYSGSFPGIIRPLLRWNCTRYDQRSEAHE